MIGQLRQLVACVVCFVLRVLGLVRGVCNLLDQPLVIQVPLHLNILHLLEFSLHLELEGILLLLVGCASLQLGEDSLDFYVDCLDVVRIKCVSDLLDECNDFLLLVHVEPALIHQIAHPFLRLKHKLGVLPVMLVPRCNLLVDQRKVCL